MKTKSILFFLVFIQINYFSFAQKEANIWYFGDHAGLDFNSGIPTPISGSSMFTYDNSSTVSDTSGNLLFYTNGETVWNKIHAVMINGSGLAGSSTGGQSALIIKQPQSSIYYIFTSDAFGASGGLRYSLVDMTLQNGFGAVTQKNILLHNPSTEKLAGIYDCKSNSSWLISHKANTNHFYAYNITVSGLVTPPLSAPPEPFITTDPGVLLTIVPDSLLSIKPELNWLQEFMMMGFSSSLISTNPQE